ncbi:MAG: DAK2 domain-containing protein [Anaerolineales bacterium]|nr:DAK2 domain-containing protein [Anaerolineales bacterium]
MTDSSTGVDEKLRQKATKKYAVLDGAAFLEFVQASLSWLRANQQIVNALNVFPVPDGDTGTNMVLTMQSAMDELESLGEHDVSDIAQAIAHGALMGARGNSGVILSQIWRGFARALDDLETMDAAAFANALQEARNTAYKGVVRPVEGTILTVSTDMAAAANSAVEAGMNSVFSVLEKVVEAADLSVQHTPELLPVLKDAGVVDSGGKGLFLIMEGMLRYAHKQPLDQPIASVQPLSALQMDEAVETIEPGQDWEVVVDFRPAGELALDRFYTGLEELGTSIQMGEGEGIYRMHIHVPDASEYRTIDYVKEYGTITNVAIENLMVQMQDRMAKQSIADLELAAIDQEQIAVVSVAPGYGLARVFASLGVAAIIEGGQTMNPSTEEILNAFKHLSAENIIILPNNRNILLAANQAAELADKHVVVVPSVSVPEGIAAMFAYEKDAALKDAAAAMTAAMKEIQTIQITMATRTVDIDDVQVKEGQVIGLLQNQLTSSGESINDVLLQTLDKARMDNVELITFYYGQDYSEEEAQKSADILMEQYPDIETEVHAGNQPHYQLIISLE